MPVASTLFPCNSTIAMQAVCLKRGNIEQVLQCTHALQPSTPPQKIPQKMSKTLHAACILHLSVAVQVQEV